MVTNWIHTDNTDIFAAAAGDLSKDISRGLCTGSRPNMDFQYNTSVWSVSDLAASITLSCSHNINLFFDAHLTGTLFSAQQTVANIHPPTTSRLPALQRQFSAAPAIASTILACMALLPTTKSMEALSLR